MRIKWGSSDEVAATAFLETSVYSKVLPSSDEPIIALLDKCGKTEQVNVIRRGQLTELYLDGCRLGHVGTDIVAEFLRENETVKFVLLWNCNIGSGGAIAIADALKHNRTVEVLDIKDNRCASAAPELIDMLLNYNVCIKVMSVSRNQLSVKSEAKIKYLTETRNKILIPDAVRRATLFIVSARRIVADAGLLCVIPKEIVKMIAIEIWATRKDPIWIQALSEDERTGE